MLSPDNVSRTWWVEPDGSMVYRMLVRGLGNDTVHAEVRVSGQLAHRGGPPARLIEHELKSKIIGAVRTALFP